ncbi:arsenate reductase/protein-tyrosine-phosphatase family protein [Naasia lichenicola]|uniref:ArsR family transcriptional regulator n=1 Tax=Naasia lichenicola TaxID=2565933 RepID=A0A4S4FLE1_9MICO|nr:MarR family transcriptional regulator [Naasia lichenicola]THG31018.1 ArsR family transcriptional regulator [Naasia lichenicola]
MNVERTNLERRTARHAALADPARLRMLDLMTLGDLSPRELQDRLGMPSNLIAHHLGVLEREGFVSRGRSEADRRRSYVRLEPAALLDLGPSSAAAARRVLFVCTANSARSQLAVELWSQRSSIPAVSAGTHPAPAIAPGAISAAERHGFSLRAQIPQSFSAVVEDTDLIVTVCDAAHEELGADALHWSIPDPVRVGTDGAFDAALEDLARRIDGLVDHISAA